MVIPMMEAMNSIVLKHSIDLLVEAYQKHLLNVAGLQPSSCYKWSRFVRLFLQAQFKRSVAKAALDQLTPALFLNYVLDQAKRWQPGHLQSMASALRSFCRFLCVSGRLPRDLSTALPAISGAHREELPTYLSPKQVTTLLKSFDRRTVMGRRDYAMVLCLVRLGLRAGEVASLKLEDLDWANGLLLLRSPKSRRDRQLPISQDVGAALTAYLRVAGATEPSRVVFRNYYTLKPLTRSGVSDRVAVALDRAKIHAPLGRAHLLRRTFATHLVQRGVSLKAVADCLGHAGLHTTQTYAKVNLPMLREVVQPWPVEVVR